MQFVNRYTMVEGRALLLVDPLGLASTCGDQKCTRSSRVAPPRNEGVYVANAEVTGTKCHGSGGCCGLNGDAYVQFDYYEIHDINDADNARANRELSAYKGRLEVRSDPNNQCITTIRNNSGEGGIWKIHVSVKCKILCSSEPGCECQSPGGIGIQAGHTIPVGPNNTTHTSGADVHSIQMLANIVFLNQDKCAFGGCNLNLRAYWQNTDYLDYDPSKDNSPNCGKKPTDRPENIPALERWYECMGYRRPTRDFDTTGDGKCIGDDAQRAQFW